MDRQTADTDATNANIQDNRNSPVASQHNVPQYRLQYGTGWRREVEHTPCSKKGHTKILLIIDRFSNFFTVRFFSTFAAQYLLKIPQRLISVAALSCETSMSKNNRQSQTNAVNNDKLQGTVVAYFKFGGIVNN